MAPPRARERVAGLPRVAAPFVGVVCFVAWSQHAVGDWWAPLRVQLENSHHGGVTDPFTALFHDARGVLHHHVGTALHVPWVLAALAMLFVCWRRLPASYTLFAAAVLVIAVAGSNLDSFERYALSAGSAVDAAAFVLTRAPARTRWCWRCSRPGWPGTRCGLSDHLGPRGGPGLIEPPFNGRLPSPAGTRGPANLPCSWYPCRGRPSSSSAPDRPA